MDLESANHTKANFDQQNRETTQSYVSKEVCLSPLATQGHLRVEVITLSDEDELETDIILKQPPTLSNPITDPSINVRKDCSGNETIEITKGRLQASSAQADIDCPICRNELDAPLTLPCNHVFCSLCIRNHTHTSFLCPICHTRFQSGDLKTPFAQLQVDQAVEGADRNGRRIEGREQTIGSSHTMVAMKLVQCPLCYKQVKLGSINSHIDSGCTKFMHQSTQAAIGEKHYLGFSSSRSNRRKMEKWVYKSGQAYSCMTDSQLRAAIKTERLDDLVRGKSRGKMIRLLKRWTDVWNANVDRPERRTTEELKEDIRNWFIALDQKDYGRPKLGDCENNLPSDSHLTSAENLININSKDSWQPSMHLVKYREEFEQLIEEIKARMASKRRKLE
jgi:hypothetical protein